MRHTVQLTVEPASSVHMRDGTILYPAVPSKSPVILPRTSYNTSFGRLVCLQLDPRGAARHLTYGIIRARYRESTVKPTLIEPERIYAYTIDLWATSYLIKAGHCVRVEISSLNFPRFDRNPNTGPAFGQDAELYPAAQTILHDTDHPFHIVPSIVPR
jgi:putative CocE/NonD family hydrolase